MSQSKFFTPANVLFGVKTFVAASLAYGLAVYFDLERPYWAMTTAYVIANPFSGAVTSKAVYRVIGTCVGGIMIVLFIPNLVNSPVLLTLAIAVWTGGCLYLAAIDRTPRSYAFILAGYTVLLTGMPLVDSPGLVFDTAVARVEEIVIAIICGAVVHRIFFPGNNGPLLLQRVDNWHRKVSSIAVKVFRNAGEVDRSPQDWQNLAFETVSMRDLVVHSSYDATKYSNQGKLVKALQHRMTLLIPAIAAIEDQLIDLRKHNYNGSSEIKKILSNIADVIESRENFGIKGYQAIKDQADKLSSLSTSVSDAESIVAANIFKRVQEVASIWKDCARLRSDIDHDRISDDSARIIELTETIPIHKNHRNALQAALTASLTVIVSIALWILTGSPEMMIVAQLSAVLVCLTAQADDPTIILRGFLWGNLLAAVGGFIFTFAVMPSVNDLIPMLAALGIFMIPMGSMAGNPAGALIGMGFCINLTNMVMFQDRAVLDLPSYMSGVIAILIATFLPITMTAVFKSMGAETSARNLLKSGWKILAKIASYPRKNNARDLLILLDILGNLAPRYAQTPDVSKIWSDDLLRDLRIGQNIVQLQKLCLEMPRDSQTPFIKFFREITKLYHRRIKFESYDQHYLLELLNKCRAEVAKDPDEDRSYKVHIILTALEICIKLNIEEAQQDSGLDIVNEEGGVVQCSN